MKHNSLVLRCFAAALALVVGKTRHTDWRRQQDAHHAAANASASEASSDVDVKEVTTSAAEVCQLGGVRILFRFRSK